LYPLDLTERIEITVAAPVPPGPDREIHGVAWQEVPGGPVAETVHSGPYTQLPLAYHALLAAVHERGLRPLGPVRETYLAGPAEAPQEELLTRLVIPVAEGTP
ncbi:GyrI-like domain-containing protein, partial [Streptomyces harbinensis]|uniref:GyrI-like domain-containing protein n=2 Tax=Streptomyces TaxID=1883 RepID=UPI0034DFE55B